MSQELSIRQQLEQTPAAQVASLPLVQNRFMQLHKTFNMVKGDIAYQAEQFHFSKIIKSSEKLSACTKLSLYGCFLDMAVLGLSFDPAMKHAYLVPFGVKTKVGQKEIWEQRAQLQISGIGELAIRVKQNQIKYADNPVLVYNGDLFKMGTKDNRLFLSHEVILPRAENAAIIACYLRITRNDDSIDYKVLTMPEIEQIKKFSKDPDSKAWTIGLPGMVQAKTIKHAFRTYPKLRYLAMTKFSALESDTVDEQLEPTDIYNLDDEHPQDHGQQQEQKMVNDAMPAAVTGKTMLSEALRPLAEAQQPNPKDDDFNQSEFWSEKQSPEVTHDDDTF